MLWAGTWIQIGLPLYLSEHIKHFKSSLFSASIFWLNKDHIAPGGTDLFVLLPHVLFFFSCELFFIVVSWSPTCWVDIMYMKVLIYLPCMIFCTLSEASCTGVNPCSDNTVVSAPYESRRRDASGMSSRAARWRGVWPMLSVEFTWDKQNNFLMRTQYLFQCMFLLKVTLKLVHIRKQGLSLKDVIRWLKS